jgi:hypothetical protein
MNGGLTYFPPVPPSPLDFASRADSPAAVVRDGYLAVNYGMLNGN